MSAPVALIGPAMSVGSKFYRPVAEAFASHGWKAELLGRRGCEPGDRRPARGVDWGFADELDDLRRAVLSARREHSGSPIVIVGNSIGGQLALLHEQHGPQVDAVVTIGASLPWWRLYPSGWRLLAMAQAIGPWTAAAGYLTKPGFAAPAAKTLMREWGQMVRHGALPLHHGARVTTPVLSINLEDDELAILPAVRRLENALVAPQALSRWTYRSAEAPRGDTGHVTWARNPGPLVAATVRWFEEITNHVEHH